MRVTLCSLVIVVCVFLPVTAGALTFLLTEYAEKAIYATIVACILSCAVLGQFLPKGGGI